MNTIFNAIKSAFEAAENRAIFTNAGYTAPQSIIVYQREYEEEESDHVPPRDYLSVEFGDVDWETIDHRKEGDLPVIIHVVQDVISFDEKQNKLLEYPELVVQVLNELAINGDILEHKGSGTPADVRHYFVPKERFVVRVTR